MQYSSEPAQAIVGFVQEAQQALEVSYEGLKTAQEAGAAADMERKLNEKALAGNLEAMKAERDSFADSAARFEKEREKPIGTDASGKATTAIQVLCQLHITAVCRMSSSLLWLLSRSRG